jgi:hypothetical protein
MRVLVCGGREFDDWDLLNHTLYELFDSGLRDLTEPFVIIQGGAKGADFLGRVWGKYKAIEYPVEVIEYPADWKQYGKAAGSIRNKQMLDKGNPDLVVAFPGGTGTADMVRRAKKAGVEVVEVKE